MAHSTLGRHRTPGRHNPVSELSVLASRAGVTGAKASAVLAASGGLVAAFALPAAAAPDSAAPATTAKAAPVAAPAAPAAISAPVAAAPVKARSIGITGVTVVAKPKPKPKPKPVVASQSNDSASDVRSTSSTPSRNQSKVSSRSLARQNTQLQQQQQKPKQNVSQSASGVVNIARSLLGIAYVYGGSTPAGFDCSGFTQYVYRKAGVSIPRTASAQQSASTRVSSPRPGDLVFWGSPAYHVAIYTGPDMMIDSPRTGKSTSERNIWGSPSGYGRF